ncbi:MAG: hypothetical protein GY803_10840, partial [Chloroflexi bacterium]|nr:hypothetical protein [Chloroflexota bacterium]
EQILQATDLTTEDRFGHGVAVYSQTIAVGAYGDDDQGSGSGSVYLFSKSGAVWNQTAKLTASDGQGNDHFGYAVAFNETGQKLVVGAHYEDDMGANAGALYQFTISSTIWSESGKYTTPLSDSGDQLGYRVAAHGNTVAGGALYHGPGHAGGAFVFTSTTTASQILPGEPSNSLDRYGRAVAMTGNVMAVGAYYADVNRASASGYVEMFRHDGAQWVMEQRLTLADTPDAPTSNDYFGAVAVSGNTVAIGACRARAGGIALGAVYIFTYNGSQWVYEATLRANDGSAEARFGYALDLEGDRLLASAIWDDELATNAGAAYLFERTGSVWTQTAKLTASNGAVNDWFGFDVALSGDTAVVGAHYADVVGSNAGLVYVYTFDGAAWNETQILQSADQAAGDHFGYAVDIHNDTILVGARLDDDNGSASGSAYLFTYDGFTWNEADKLTAADGQAADYFGAAVTFNETGQGLLVGAYWEDEAAADAGAAYYFTSDGTTWTEQAKFTPANGGPSDHFGIAVALYGNHLAVGARYHASATGRSGAVFSYDAAVGLQTTTIQYEYDPLYRLTKADYSGGVQASYDYVYDAVGNMTAFTETVGLQTTAVTRQFNAANQLQSTNRNVGGISAPLETYAYDNNGNLITITPSQSQVDISFIYNQRNLLTRRTTPPSCYPCPLPAIDFVYDGDGNRLQQINHAANVTTTYHNDNMSLSQVLMSDDGTTQT